MSPHLPVFPDYLHDNTPLTYLPLQSRLAACCPLTNAQAPTLTSPQPPTTPPRHLLCPCALQAAGGRFKKARRGRPGDDEWSGGTDGSGIHMALSESEERGSFSEDDDRLVSS